MTRYKWHSSPEIFPREAQKNEIKIKNIYRPKVNIYGLLGLGINNFLSKYSNYDIYTCKLVQKLTLLTTQQARVNDVIFSSTRRINIASTPAQRHANVRSPLSRYLRCSKTHKVCKTYNSLYRQIGHIKISRWSSTNFDLFLYLFRFNHFTSLIYDFLILFF